MTGPQQDAYAAELARVSEHQRVWAVARLRLFELLAGGGVPLAEADELVSCWRPARWPGGHTWVAESSASHGSAPAFDDGWFAA